MVIELDTQHLWVIAGAIITFIALLLKMLAAMTVNGIHKKIDDCHDSIMLEIKLTKGIAIRAHNRIDDLLSHKFKSHFESYEEALVPKDYDL